MTATAHAWVITGASRGIGLEFVRQLASRGQKVVAGARDPRSASELAALASKHESLVSVHPCDVASDDSVAAFAKKISGPVDVLVNNAGVYGKLQGLESLDFADAHATFETNALGPLRVTRALLPQLLESDAKKLVHITSGMGSIQDNSSGGAYTYRMSKAALNMANKSLSVDYARRGLVAVVMNPGWVQTDMGGRGAPTTVHESVSKMLERIDGMTKADNGTFLDYKGGTFPF